MRILVTGGAGLIGSTILDALHENDDEPVALDDLSMGDRANVSASHELIVADVADLAETSCR